MEQQEQQVRWPQAEIDRVANRIRTDYHSAIADHNRRIQRWREYYRRWRAAVNVPGMGEEAASNVPVPYIRWNIFTKWAKEMDSLFGDDAEIVAVPVGPSDYKRDTKISKYMTWRVFNSMKLTNPFCVFVLRKILFGRSFAYAPWKRDTFEVLNPDKGYEPEEIVDYDGPDFQPLWPDDLIVPAEEVPTIQDFSFVVRRVRVRPDELLEGEEDGRYFGITKNWAKIINFAQRGQQRDMAGGEEIKQEQDDAEGIVYQRPLSSGEWITVLEWYGRWRPLKAGVGKKGGGSQKDASEWDFSKREMRQKEFKVSYILDMDLVIGVQDLQVLYPTMKARRPFVETSMVKDGSYWSPGLAEMLIDVEDELRSNHNQATEAGQMAMSPPFGYRPASGANAETFRLEPGLFIPLDNPATDIRQIEIKADMALAEWKQQAMMGFGQRLTGLTDLSMGRQEDRPNAPKTVGQTQALLEEGNVRLRLDALVLAEDMSAVVSHFWALEYMFSPEEQFFRVTEDDADGLFPVHQGGSMLTLEDRDGRYDFKLKFANSVWSKEAKKAQTLARYQLDLQNPLIVSNPVALWEVTNQAHDALGDPNFADLVPRPPQPDMSIDPKQEWTMLLQGEDIHVNPMDNDLVHMTRHAADLKRAQQDPQTDPDAIKALVVHYHDHITQLQQKRVQQAVLEQAAAAAQQIAAGGDPLQMAHGLFGNPPSQPPGNPQAQEPQIYSGHPEIEHAQ